MFLPQVDEALAEAVPTDEVVFADTFAAELPGALLCDGFEEVVMSREGRDVVIDLLRMEPGGEGTAADRFQRLAGQIGGAVVEFVLGLALS